jgi:hypothetical protein
MQFFFNSHLPGTTYLYRPRVNFILGIIEREGVFEIDGRMTKEREAEIDGEIYYRSKNSK